MFSINATRSSDLPVEVEVLLHSTEIQLRQAALRLVKIAADPAALAGLRNQMVVFSLPGGGASVFARHLASLACVRAGARLVYAHSSAAPESMGSCGRNPPPVVRLGPGSTCTPPLPQSCLLSVFFDEGEFSPNRCHGGDMAVFEIPPLASRRGDSLLAADLMVRNFFPPGMRLSDDARELIADFRWPGEIAHLRVTLGVAAQLAFASGVHVVDARQIMAVISRKELNLAALCRLDHTGWSFPIAGRDLLQLATFTGFARVKKALELLLIEGAVASSGGSATGAARQLGLPYTTLVSRQKALRVDAHG